MKGVYHGGLHHVKELGLYTPKAPKTALKLHAHSVLYAHHPFVTGTLLKNLLSKP